MPGREEPFVTGEIYHIFNRGITNLDTYRNLRDYYRFLETLRFYEKSGIHIRFSYFVRLPIERKNEIVSQTSFSSLVDILCYCLMPNHFHLLLKQTSENGISNFLRLISDSYSRYYNTKHRRRGPIYQGRFKSVRIIGEEQLIHISRYIHLNPYSSGVVKTLKDLENYPLSSFGEYLGQTTANLCHKKTVLGRFTSPEEYKQFVLSQADYQRQLESIKHLLLEI